MPWYYAVAELDHELQNPTSRGEDPPARRAAPPRRRQPRARHGLWQGRPGDPARVEFGCRVVGVERSPEFAEAARERVASAGLAERVEIVEGDAAAFPIDPGTFDAALCLGASFVWDGLDGTLEALIPAVRAGGHVAVGEPFWRSWPLPDGVDDLGYLAAARRPQPRSSARVSRSSTLIASSRTTGTPTSRCTGVRSRSGWRRNPDEPDAPTIRERFEEARDAYLRCERTLLGWAIFVGWKPRLGRARERLALEQRAEPLGLEQVPPAEARFVDLELGEDRDGVGGSGSGGLPVLRDEPVAELVEARGASKMRRTTSCGETVPFQRFSCSRNATSQRPAGAYESRYRRRQQ